MSRTVESALQPVLPGIGIVRKEPPREAATTVNFDNISKTAEDRRRMARGETVSIGVESCGYCQSCNTGHPENCHNR